MEPTPWPQRLQAALRATRTPLARAVSEALADALPQALADTGLAHHHLRLPGTGLLARLPKQSQMRLSPEANLRYQAACFARAQASGHTPRLAGVLAPQPALPWGALLVEEITGRAPRLSGDLPRDLPALMQALARIHALQLPPPSQRAPLLRAARPAARMLQEIDAQALHLAAPAVAPASRARIRAVRRAWRAPRPAPACLIAFDTHPGNFIVRADGQAVLVDLEKARYSLPALDVAHATLYTSTTWDLASHAVLAPAQVAQGYAVWRAALGSAAGHPDDWLAWRQAMWLWSVTWCAQWLAGPADGNLGAAGDALFSHVHERVLHYLDPQTVHDVADGFDALARLLRA